jgi:hypothetical protein
MWFLAIVQFFAKNQYLIRGKLQMRQKFMFSLLLYGRKYSESGDLEGGVSRRFCYFVKNCGFNNAITYFYKC